MAARGYIENLTPRLVRPSPPLFCLTVINNHNNNQEGFIFLHNLSRPTLSHSGLATALEFDCISSGILKVFSFREPLQRAHFQERSEHPGMRV